MPDPPLYLKAMVMSASVSALVVLTLGWVRRHKSATTNNSVCALAICGGVAVGYYIMRWRLAWPPANGLDRFLTIVFPAAIGIEILAGFSHVPPRLVRIMRLTLAVMSGRILLHGSIYLTGETIEWTTWRTVATLTVCAGLFAAIWTSLLSLAKRSFGIAIPLALALAIHSAGVVVMLAGYLKGGSAAFPLAAAIAGTAITVSVLTKRTCQEAVLGIGLVGLFGVLFIGRFFGRLSTGQALVLLLTPLLCWVSQLPVIQRQKRWIVESVRLLTVAIPLVVVLFFAKSRFDRELAPLMGAATSLEWTIDDLNFALVGRFSKPSAPSW